MNSQNSMKKTLSIASVGMMLGFAIALANAEESTSTNTSTNGYSTSSEMPGTVGTTPSDSGTTQSGTTSQDSSMTGSSTESGTTVSEYDNMRSCTDRNGVTFRKGEAGFSDCISWMKENRKGDMSGQAGSQTMPPTNGTSSGDLGTTDSGTGSDTGASGSTTDSGSTTPSS